MAKTENNSKNQYESYWEEDVVEVGLSNGSLIEGVLRINPKNYREAYITAPDGSADILIEGLLNRNKALNGDVVVCTIILSTSQAKEPAAVNKSSVVVDRLNGPKKKKDKIVTNVKENLCSKESANPSEEIIVSEGPIEKNKKETPSKKRNNKSLAGSLSKKKSNGTVVKGIEDNKTPIIESKDCSIDFPTPQHEGEENSIAAKKKRSRRSRKKKNEISVLSDKLSSSCTVESKTDLQTKTDTIIPAIVKDDSETGEINVTSPRKSAKVVFIKELKHSRRAIGHLRPWPHGLTGNVPKWILFAPKDHRIPRLKIPFNPDIMMDCLAQPNMLYLAQIESWEDVNNPLGSLSYCVGISGNVEAETVALLLEHGVDYSPFPPNILEDLPSLPWSIPEDEMRKRRDFRDQCIFTIDPADARDLDDAVSGRILETAEDGSKLYEISVHIADVSFFVKERTALDGIASDRATSNYLVDRVIPMLPSVLCEHVCSLNPGEDRLAFSVEWTINDKGEILKEWFGRSVIRSCVKLSYDHAQAVIEGQDEVKWPDIKGSHSVGDIRKTIEVLQELAVILRKNRFDQGALRIDMPRLSFNMDWKTRTPIGFRVYELKDSNRLIEEFMLLANTRVAEKIHKSFPSIAVLRSHSPPSPLKLQQVSNSLATLGIHLDVSDSKALQESLLRYGQSSNDPVLCGVNLVISNLLAKPMQRATYICAGLVKCEKLFRHYALSVPFYTHFTSPIRRYPDILVHRLLSASLEGNQLDWHFKTVGKQLDNCNDRKLAAKTLQDAHSELHLSAFIRKSGSIEVKGIVVGVLDHAVDIVFLYLGITRRVYLEKLPVELKFEKYNDIGRLTLDWKEEPGCPPTRQCITVFSLLEVLLVPHEKDELQFNLILQRPTTVDCPQNS